jgi:hypothetical protein
MDSQAQYEELLGMMKSLLHMMGEVKKDIRQLSEYVQTDCGDPKDVPRSIGDPLGPNDMDD